MKAQEIRAKKSEELEGLEDVLKKELAEAQMLNRMGQLKDTSRLSKIREDLARIYTIRREKEKTA